MKRIPFEDEHLDDNHFGVNGLDHSMYEDEESKRKQKKKKHKKDKKKEAELNGLSATPPPEPGALSFAESPVGWYNGQEAKGNLGNAAMKGLVDVGVAAVGSSYLAAALGKYAVYVGAAIAIAGHYMGDKTGIIRALGAGVVAHGIAKSQEYNSETSSVLGRIMSVKDDIFRAFLLKKYKEENGVNGLDDLEEQGAQLVEIKLKEPAEKAPDSEENPVEGLDESEFDKYDDFLAREAQRFAAENEHLQGHDFGNDDEEEDDDLQGYDENEVELQGHLEEWQKPQFTNPINSQLDSLDPDRELFNLDPGELGYNHDTEEDY